MSGTLTRSEIRTLLEQRGFVRDGDAQAHAERWRLGTERVFLKTGDRLPLVIHPDHEPLLPKLLAVSGVSRDPTKQYTHNSNFSGFPKRKHTGQREEAFGLDFGFDSPTALNGFLDALGIADGAGETDEAAAPNAVGSVQGASGPRFDREAVALVERFREPHNDRLMEWKPRYSATIDAVERSLRTGELEAAFELVWLAHDNWVSYAGQGILGRESVDRHRDDLMTMLKEIWADGSPAHFDQLVDVFQSWYRAGTMPKVPRLLLARAFATVHPERYHTTVSRAKHEAVIPWFARHTGFVAPSGEWATRAAALTEHLERSGLFAGERARRNMFPWYVFETMDSPPTGTEFRPEHVSKVRHGVAVSPEERREVQYRQNIIQDRLVARLRAIHGDHVGSEQQTGTGGKADVLVRLPAGRWALYEIKPADCARQAVREAIGQLLEYGYRRGAYPEVTLHIVSDAPPDEVTDEYLETLEERFNLSFEYLQISSEPDDPDGC